MHSTANKANVDVSLTVVIIFRTDYFVHVVFSIQTHVLDVFRSEDARHVASETSAKKNWLRLTVNHLPLWIPIVKASVPKTKKIKISI